MKNKKGTVEMSIGTIVTILLLIAVLIFGLVLVKTFFDEPQFTIYKEECRNETIPDEALIKQLHKVQVKIYDLEKGFINGWCSAYSGLGISYCYNHSIELKNTIERIIELDLKIRTDLINETFCEQVEVDEIYLDYDESIGCLGKYGEDVYVDNRDYNSIKCFISKKYLTIEWLDKNCECLECKGGGFIHLNACCYDVGDFDGKRLIEIGEEYSKFCDKYKYGKYFVEVKE